MRFHLHNSANSRDFAKRDRLVAKVCSFLAKDWRWVEWANKRSKLLWNLTEAEFALVQLFDAIQFKLHKYTAAQVGRKVSKPSIARLALDLNRTLDRRHRAAQAVITEGQKQGGRRRLPVSGY